MSDTDELRRPNEPCQQCGHGETAHEHKCRIRGCPCSLYYASRSRLEAEVDSLRARVEALTAGESEEPAPDGVVPTPAEWLHKFNRASGEKRLQVIEQLQRDSDQAVRCFQMDHEHRLEQHEHRIAALTAERDALGEWCQTNINARQAAESALSRVRTLADEWSTGTMDRSYSERLLAAIETPETTEQSDVFYDVAGFEDTNGLPSQENQTPGTGETPTTATPT